MHGIGSHCFPRGCLPMLAGPALAAGLAGASLPALGQEKLDAQPMPPEVADALAKAGYGHAKIVILPGRDGSVVRLYNGDPAQALVEAPTQTRTASPATSLGELVTAPTGGLLYCYRCPTGICYTNALAE